MESDLRSVQITKFINAGYRTIPFDVHDDDWYEFSKSEIFSELQNYIYRLGSKHIQKQ